MLTLAFAQDAGAQAAAGPAQSNPIMSLLPIALIFIIFYFLLIRPQKKSRKEHADMIEALKKNDEVTTSGGMYGTIVNIQEGVVTLRVDDNTRIKVQRSSISALRKAKEDVSQKEG